MRTEKVNVVPYDPDWNVAFEAIATEIMSAVGDLAMRIEHVGSTSVEGLSAKPIIDIDVVIRDYSVFNQIVDRLAEIGYIHEGDFGIPEREAFRYEEKPHLCPHHLYVCPQDSRELHRHLTFRNFLRTNPEAAKKYSKIKETAAMRFPDDIDKYMAYKSSCIEELYAQCGL